jgi:hypothetical protein
MKPISFAVLLLLIPPFLKAQGTDSLDNIVMKIPASCKINKQPNYIELTLYNKEESSYCQVTIHQKQFASMNMNDNFEKEWNDLVLATFETTTSVVPQLKKSNAGPGMLSFGAEAINRSTRAACYVELNMFDCGRHIQSAIIISGSKKNLQSFEASWQSLILQVK